MPIVNPDKLIAVLLCAALALSCYPMPVRAWADEGAGDEVVSEGSSGSFDG